MISIVFPATFVLITSTTYDLYYINYGLEDISEYSTVYLNVVSSNQILISNFKATNTNTEVAITLRMKNPNANGYTTPLKIISYTNSSQTVIIDQDLVSAKTTIIDYTATSSLTLLGITASNTLANGALTDLSFQINPAVKIPAGGYFKIRVPNDFTIVTPISPINCELYDSGTWKTAQGCVSSGNIITIWNQIDLTYPVGSVGQFRVLGQVKTPTYNSYFIIL